MPLSSYSSHFFLISNMYQTHTRMHTSMYIYVWCMHEYIYTFLLLVSTYKINRWQELISNKKISSETWTNLLKAQLVNYIFQYMKEKQQIGPWNSILYFSTWIIMWYMQTHTLDDRYTQVLQSTEQILGPCIRY